MRTKTSTKQIKDITKALLKTVPVKCDNEWGIVQHPFTNSSVAYIKDHGMVDLLSEDGYKAWVQYIEEGIDKMSLKQIFHILINDPWNLTWLKYAKPYMSKKVFSEFLAQAWTTEENPNQDCNVSRAEAIKWFKEADKKVLMSKEDYAYWEALPEEVTLYRGVSRGREKYGLSWTDQEDTAIWFRNRWATEEHEGQLLKVVAKKQHCLCYLNIRGEKEIVLDVNAIKKHIEEIE